MTSETEFETFMQNYQNMVYGTALRLLGRPEDAEDIAQAVFLKAYEAFADIGRSPTAGGWLKTVTTNLSLNHLSRYRARWRFFSELRSDDTEREFEDTLAAPETFDAQMTRADDHALLEQALHKLPDAQRVPLVLFHFEDLDYEQIAARLRISLSKVKTDIHRGRLALKKYLEPNLAGDSRWNAHPVSQPIPASSPTPRQRL